MCSIWWTLGVCRFIGGCFRFTCSHKMRYCLLARACCLMHLSERVRTWLDSRLSAIKAGYSFVFRTPGPKLISGCWTGLRSAFTVSAWVCLWDFPMTHDDWRSLQFLFLPYFSTRSPSLLSSVIFPSRSAWSFPTALRSFQLDGWICQTFLTYCWESTLARLILPCPWALLTFPSFR